ncbi:hypothetical protein MP638_003522 [Amoeboaphelidium occidentale]|nr:hypothetical protein MP638_003522 [Amoeboaphelidium occidentale]
MKVSLKYFAPLLLVASALALPQMAGNDPQVPDIDTIPSGGAPPKEDIPAGTYPDAAPVAPAPVSADGEQVAPVAVEKPTVSGDETPTKTSEDNAEAPPDGIYPPSEPGVSPVPSHSPTPSSDLYVVPENATSIYPPGNMNSTTPEQPVYPEQPEEAIDYDFINKALQCRKDKRLDDPDFLSKLSEHKEQGQDDPAADGPPIPKNDTVYPVNGTQELHKRAVMTELYPANETSAENPSVEAPVGEGSANDLYPTVSPTPSVPMNESTIYPTVSPTPSVPMNESTIYPTHNATETPEECNLNEFDLSKVNNATLKELFKQMIDRNITKPKTMQRIIRLTKMKGVPEEQAKKASQEAANEAVKKNPSTAEAAKKVASSVSSAAKKTKNEKQTTKHTKKTKKGCRKYVQDGYEYEECFSSVESESSSSSDSSNNGAASSAAGSSAASQNTETEPAPEDGEDDIYPVEDVPNVEEDEDDVPAGSPPPYSTNSMPSNDTNSIYPSGDNSTAPAKNETLGLYPLSDLNSSLPDAMNATKPENATDSLYPTEGNNATTPDAPTEGLYPTEGNNVTTPETPTDSLYPTEGKNATTPDAPTEGLYPTEGNNVTTPETPPEEVYPTGETNPTEPVAAAADKDTIEIPDLEAEKAPEEPTEEPAEGPTEPAEEAPAEDVPAAGVVYDTAAPQEGEAEPEAKAEDSPFNL